MLAGNSLLQGLVVVRGMDDYEAIVAVSNNNRGLFYRYTLHM